MPVISLESMKNLSIDEIVRLYQLGYRIENLTVDSVDGKVKYLTYNPAAGAAPSPASSIVSETTFGQTSVVGTSTNYARQDHSHGTPSDAALEHVSNKNAPGGYAGLDSNKTIAHLIPKVASNNIRNSHDAEIIQSTPGYPTYIKFKTITLTKGLRGTARFLFDIHAETSGTVRGQIYRNGVALGSIQTETSYSYVTKSQDITQEWVAGNTCELWCNGAFSRAFARNFRIAYDDAPNVVESSNSTP